MGEMNYYGVDLSKTAVVERTVNIDNVLDLTDPSVQKELGVSPSQLTVDDYSVLSLWAVGHQVSTMRSLFLPLEHRERPI